jgi:hypothetical protein
MAIKSNNAKVLNSFVKFCRLNPELRFWQALRTWAKVGFIYVCNDPSGEGESIDTFYWEGRNK